MIDKPCLTDQYSDVELYKAGEYFCSVGCVKCVWCGMSVIWEGGLVA